MSPEQKMAALGQYIDGLRKSLCSVCRAGICSAHQPAAGFIAALDDPEGPRWWWPMGSADSEDAV